jgi:small subunit ribosomal protein S3
MGQKTHPIGLRLGIVKQWSSRWFATKEMPALLKEDELIRKYLKTRLGHAAISEVHIERRPGKVTITIHTGRPGVVIGKRGAEVDKLRDELAQLTGKEAAINVEEIKRPELSAQLVGDNIAHQLTQRISFRRAMKRAVQSAMRMGAQAIKVRASGRLGGAEIARTEGYHEGRVPLHTLRADIDYATSTAKTTYGTIGIKVWIFKGEVVEDMSGRTYSTGACVDAGAEANQVSQAVQGPHQGDCHPGEHGGLRRVRAHEPGAGVGHQPPDRGVPRRHDPGDETGRQGVAPDLSGQADHEEAGRDPHGQGQG